MTYFQYSSEDVEWLKKSHPRMRLLIETAGPIKRKIWPDPFMGLIRCVLGQQISSKAHSAVWDRFSATYGNLTPAELAKLPPERIKTVGASLRKAECIKKIAENFASGAFQPKKWKNMGPHELGGILTKLPGIGPWTVDMLLIFSLGHPDIISWHDGGIRAALKILYDRKDLKWADFMDLTRKYAPVGSLASMYLWELASGKFPHLAEQLKSLP